MQEIKNTYRTTTILKIGILFLIACFISLKAYSQANIYVLKAVYLEKFSRFVTWPPESEMSNKNKPFVIGVVGKTPLYKNLKQIYSIKKINNKPVEIKKIATYDEIKQCHILVIAESERKNLQEIILITENFGILTIGDSPSFAENGVLINFFEENNKLRFEINETAVIKSPIQMSFYLMNSAQIVHPVKDN